jgi:hypothetical protein
MAISINQQPSTWITAGTPVNYRVGGNLYLNGGQARPDYKIICKLFRIDLIGGVPQAPVIIGTFVGIPSISKTFVASSITYYFVDFNLAEPMLADLPTPHFSATIGRSTSNLLRTYKADFNEFYDNTNGTVVPSAACVAIPAGRPLLRNYDLATIIAQHLTPGASQRFLNNVVPGFGRMLYNEPLTLNFYNSYTSGFVNLKATVLYQDGNTIVPVNWLIYTGGNPGVNFLQWQILLSGVSWNSFLGDPFWGVDLSEPFEVENIYQITFEVTNPSTAVSEAVTYQVLHALEHRYGRAYYFVNSLGFMETLVTTGLRMAKNKLQADDAEVFANNSNAASTKILNGNLAQYNHLLTQEFVQSVGYTSPTLYNAFRDFVRSRIKYLKIGAYYYPIVLSKMEFDDDSDDQTLFGHEFTYKLASLEGYIL